MAFPSGFTSTINPKGSQGSSFFQPFKVSDSLRPEQRIPATFWFKKLEHRFTPFQNSELLISEDGNGTILFLIPGRCSYKEALRTSRFRCAVA
jgi:hypothetical protein